MKKTPHLLVVDDDANVAFTLQAFLESEGYTVKTASDPQEMENMLPHENFDVAIVDLRLGDSSGMSVLKTLRKEQSQCAVIILTGYASVESAVDALRQGAYDYLMKPCDLDELKLTVEAAMVQGPMASPSRAPADIDLLSYLRKSKGQFASMLSGITDGILVQDASGHLVYANQPVADLFGYESPQSMLDLAAGNIAKMVEVMDEAGHPLSLANLPWQAVLQGTKTQDVNLRFRNQDDNSERIALVKSNLVMEDDRIESLVTTFTDITERTRAEKELATQNQIAQLRLHRLQRIAEGFLTIRVAPLSETIKTVLDTMREAIGMEVVFCQYQDESHQFVFNNTEDAKFKKLASLALNEKGESWEFINFCRQPTYIPNTLLEEHWSGLAPEVLSLHIIPVTFTDKLFGLLMTLSPQLNGIKPEERYIADSVGAFTGSVLENSRLYDEVQLLAAQAERHRISQELHDNLAQFLAYINIKIHVIEKVMESGQSSDALQQLLELSTAVQQESVDVRKRIVDLRSQATLEQPLQTFLHDHIKNYESQWGGKVRLQWQVKIQELGLTPFQEFQLSRIVMEALSNVRKHSQATELKVRFSHHADNLELEISDNGVGFNPAAPGKTDRPSLGLKIMRERASAIAANLEVSSGEGKGTTVRLRMPVAHDAKLGAKK